MNKIYRETCHYIVNSIVLVYFNWLILVWQKRFPIRDFHIRELYNRDTVFPESSRRISQNIYSFMEMTDHDKYMHKISLKKASSCWRKYVEDFTSQKVDFSYNPSERPDARVRTPSLESQSPIKVAQQKRCLEEVRTAQ